ncbi:MAG: AAA family ATPase [Candidatus ainarchaeum sp.]|nr:AAA family ATPase [Candidatus ainarchaeum sp.]
MINSLTLINWRTHKETKINFEKGTNVIIGVMGAGKSSIVNALSFALFGTFPQLKSKQVSLKEIIMNKPNKMDYTKVILEFSHNGLNYIVDRKIVDGATEAYLRTIDSKLIAGPKQKDVNEKIESILGLNYELFSRAIYAEQNEIDFFLKLSPGERKKKFDELLDLEKYEIARKNSLTLKNQFVKEFKQKNDFVNQQKKLIENYEEEKLNVDLLSNKNELVDLNSKLDLLNSNFLTIRSEKEVADKKLILFNQLKDEIIKTKTKIETLSSSIAGTNLQSKEDLDRKKEETFSKKLSLIKLKEAKENEKSILDLSLKKIWEEKKVNDFKLKEIDFELKEMLNLVGTCPKCKQNLDENHKKSIIELNESNKLKIINENNSLLEKEKEITQEITKIKNEMAINDKLIESLNSDLFNLQINEKKLIELNEKKNQIDLLKEKIPKLETEFVNLKIDQTIVDEIKQKYFELKGQIDLLKSKLISKQDLIKSIESNLIKIKKIKDSIASIEIDAINDEIVSKKLGVFENCLISTQNELRLSMIDTINIAMSDIWQNVYPYKDYIDAKLIINDNGYDFVVLNRNNEWVRVDGILSGGERSAGALCIRIAFALVLTKNLSMLILDEPTHNLDYNAIDKLSEMFREKLPTLVEQIFVITHEKAFETATNGKTILLTRDKSLDESTKVILENEFD